jgi:hypothetical protein
MLNPSTLLDKRLTMANLHGTWIYQSFRPDDGTPSLVTWAPTGELSVTTDATGKVDGELKFPSVPGLELTISGSITPAVPGNPPRPGLPEGVELTGEGGRQSVNKLRGYFIAGSPGPLIVGTIVAAKNDPAGRPDGTSGPFVLFPTAKIGE